MFNVHRIIHIKIVYHYLVELEGEDGEDDGVLEDGAEHHEDAGHDERVDGVQLRQSRGRGVGADAVEDVDEDEEEDDQERHPPGDHLARGDGDYHGQ